MRRIITGIRWLNISLLLIQNWIRIEGWQYPRKGHTTNADNLCERNPQATRRVFAVILNWWRTRFGVLMHEKLCRTRGRCSEMIYEPTEINSINAASCTTIQTYLSLRGSGGDCVSDKFSFSCNKIRTRNKEMINKVKYNPDEGNRLCSRSRLIWLRNYFHCGFMNSDVLFKDKGET